MKKSIVLGFFLMSLTCATILAGTDSASIAKQNAVMKALSDSAENKDVVKLKIVSNIVDSAMKNAGENGMNFNTMLVATSPFWFALVIIIVFQIFRYKRNKEMNALYSKYLESGKDIPAELLNPAKPKSSELKKGIILIAVGAGVCIFLFAQKTSNAWTMGLIPFFIGLGFLIVHKLNSKQGN